MLIKKLHIFLILMIMLFFIKIGLPQQADTTVMSIEISTKQKPAVTQKDSLKKLPPKNKLKSKGFMDKNADGIDDRLADKKGKGRGKQLRRRDVFIDKNGDGICDGRESAIGLKKAMHRRGRKK